MCDTIKDAGKCKGILKKGMCASSLQVSDFWDHGPQGIGISQECWCLQRDLFIGQISHNANFLEDRRGTRSQWWVSDGQDYTMTQLFSYACLCPLFKSKPGIWTLKMNLERVGHWTSSFFLDPAWPRWTNSFSAVLMGSLRAGGLSVACQGSRAQTSTVITLVTRTNTPKYDTLTPKTYAAAQGLFLRSRSTAQEQDICNFLTKTALTKGD